MIQSTSACEKPLIELFSGYIGLTAVSSRQQDSEFRDLKLARPVFQQNTSDIKMTKFASAGRVRRDRIVVSTLRCGRNNPGSNPGHGTFFSSSILYFFIQAKTSIF